MKNKTKNKIKAIGGMLAFGGFLFSLSYGLLTLNSYLYFGAIGGGNIGSSILPWYGYIQEP